MSRTNEQNTQTTERTTEVYMDPAQEAKLGLLILSKRINDLDSNLTARLDALESATSASAESNDEESIWEICDEIAASEASRYHREEFERRKRRRALDLHLSKVRSKRAKAERKVAQSAARKAALQKKFADVTKEFISSWTLKRTYKLLFAVLIVVSMLMYFMCYSFLVGFLLIIPGLMMIMPSYRESRSQLMSKLDGNSKFLFTLFESYIGMCGVWNMIILIVNGVILTFC